VIVVEDLSVENMQRRGASAASVQNGKLPRHITQVGWARLSAVPKTNANGTGRTLVTADNWFPSS